MHWQQKNISYVRKGFLLLIFFFAACALSLYAGEESIGPVETDRIHWYWSVFHDTDAAYDIQSIRNLPDSEWGGCGQERRNLGYTRDVVWCRVTMQSVSAKPLSCFLELMSTRLEYVDWYIMDGTNLVKTCRSGSLVREPQVMADFRKPVVLLDLPAKGTLIAYLKIRSQTAIQIKLKVETAEQYVGDVARSESISAALIGLMVGLLLLVYLFSWGFHEPYHAVYAAGMTLLGLVFPVMGGYHVWLNLPGLEFWTHHAVIVLTNTAMLLLLLHAILFLRLKEWMPRITYGVYAYMTLVVVITTAVLFFSFRYAIQLVIGNIFLCTLWMMGVSITGVYRRDRDAWFYLLGNGVLWIYLWIQMFYYYGWVTIDILPETLGLSSLVLALCTFVVSMIQRVRMLRYEKENAQLKTIELQEKMNSELEALVEERTRELHGAKEAAEQANQVKTAFFSKVSHDLRAPLNWLVGLVESLWLESSSLNLSEDFLAYLQYIKKGSYYLTQLLNNIMDVGAIESGKADQLHVEPVNIGEWSDNIASIVYALGKSSGVDVSWMVEERENLAAFLSDPVKLSQILMNLVHNAIKVTPSGKRVGIVIGLHGSELCVTVEDEGPGLPKDSPDMYESYHQKGKSGKLVFDGVGLGLFIVKSNLTRLRGSISAQNRQPEGAVFCVKIPSCEPVTDKEL